MAAPTAAVGKLAQTLRFFVTALAWGAAVAGPSISQAAAETGGRLTIGDAGRGPSRFRLSFVQDVGLLTT